MNRVQGKIALVTGAGRGIGRACAELLAREGAAVYLTDREARWVTGSQLRIDGGATAE
jgi:cyclopentanol dehydrogenase